MLDEFGYDALVRAQTDRRRVQEDDRRRVKQRLLSNVGLKSQHTDSASAAPTAPPATSTTAGWFFRGDLSYGFCLLAFTLAFEHNDQYLCLNL